VFIQVESLAWDIDFKSKVTRDAFETACADLKGRFAQPILDALSDAELTLVSHLSAVDNRQVLISPQDNITSVILTGGSTRTPMIQAAVRAAVGESVAFFHYFRDVF